MKAVLLEGYINVESTIKISEELNSALRSREEEIVLVIKSEGGDILPSIDLIFRLHQCEKNDCKINVQIYCAQSMASIIALSVGSRRSLRVGSSIGLHRGVIKNMEASELNLITGVVSQNILHQFRRYDAHLHDLLKKYHVSSDKDMMATLLASNYLEIPAQKCLELGMVHELF